jgi:hypothetical protein
MSEALRRRSSDSKSLDIEDMIADENDPKQRAFLIVLNSINNGLMANTTATRDMSDKFDSHLSAYDQRTEAESEMVNKARGAWRILAWVLGACQALVLMLGTALFNDLGEMHTMFRAGQLTDVRLEARIINLESKK